MQLTQLSPHIWKLSKRMLGVRVQVYLVIHSEGVTLVDAGLKSFGKPIVDAIHHINAGPLAEVVLTHGHSDHVGALDYVLSLHSAPVYAHADEFLYMEGKLPYPKRKKPQASVKPGLARPLSADDAGTLLPHHDLHPYYTPGHSPGHVAYYHAADDVLIGGDLFTSKNGQLRRPYAIFTPFMEQAVESGSIVTVLQPQLLTICHGDEVVNPNLQYENYRRAATAKSNR